MIKGENKLTTEIKKLLKQGTKVEFKWHGSKDLYIGRIELDIHNNIYFINEHCFEKNKLKDIYEGMRYYNMLDSFYFFNHFKIII